MTEEPASQAGQPLLARVSVVIVNFNSGPWLSRCVRELKPNAHCLPHIVILDNASADDSIDRLEAMPGLQIVRQTRNLGFARGVNQAAGQVDSEFLLILNPDCLLARKALVELLDELQGHPECGLVSGRVFDLHGHEQRASRRRLPRPRRVLAEVLPFSRRLGVDLTHLPAPTQSSEVEAVSGACLLMRTAAFRALDGFDTAYPMHFEDLDLMRRLGQAGWTIRLVPDVAIVHVGGVSSSHRPLGVEWARHWGLWRYLQNHCRDGWSVWSRPLWWLAIWAHFLVTAPRTLGKRK